MNTEITELNKIYKTYNHIQNDKKEPKEHHYTATLRYTSPHFTQLHFTTLHSLTFTLHYPLTNKPTVVPAI
jgi:hypothetical protein